MKKRSLALFLVLGLTMSMALSACGNKSKDSSKETGTEETGTEETGSTTEATTLSVVLGPEPDTIDPALNSAADAGMMIDHSFEGLTRLKSDAVTYIPAEAEDWDISEDGLTYTFHLREGLKWSDGSPLTANDYVYSWNRVVNPDTAADYEYLFDIIDGYEDKKLNVVATDDNTLVVTLKAMCPYFLELVAFDTFYPVKQDIIESAGESWTLDPATYVSNGPYKLKEWVHDSYILMEQNENYWDIANVGPKEIKFVLMSDPSAQLAAFESGEVAFIDDIPTSEIAAQKEQSDFHMDPQLSVAYVQFNTQNEYLSNPLLRKALTLAVDRTYICEQIGQAGQQPTSAFVPTGLSDADPTQDFRTVGGEYYNATDYEGNVELAKQALEDAGYPNGEGLPTFNYLTNDAGTNVDIAEALQDMWSKIGINLNIDVQEWNTMLVSRKDGEFDITRGGWAADYNDPITFLDMFVTGGGNNDPQWSNADYDALIKKIKTTSDSAERIQYLHDAEDLMMNDWIICPLFNTVDLYKASDKLQGYYVSKLGHKYFQNATLSE
ncbi:MAG: ABC transporter substrate-binding protein [Velocimicrobium sp.]